MILNAVLLVLFYNDISAHTSCIVHTKLPPSPAILWIELGGKPKWLPINFGIP